MKVNCKALRIAIRITVVLICIIGILIYAYSKENNNEILELVKDIVLGLLSSSIVSIFFYASAYNVEKRKLLELYWNEIRKLLNQISKIDFLYLQYDSNLFCNFLLEERSNKWKKEYNKNLEVEQVEIFDNYTKKLTNIIIDEYTDGYTELSESGKEKFIKERMDNIKDKMKKDVDKIILEYIEISNENLENVSNLLGDMEFFVSSNSYKKAFELYYQIKQVMMEITIQSFYFKSYLKGDDNYVIVIKKILNLQDKLFKIENTCTDNEDTIIVFKSFCDNMHKKLEEFRAKVIYKVEPEYIKDIPVLQKVYIKRKEKSRI